MVKKWPIYNSNKATSTNKNSVGNTVSNSTSGVYISFPVIIVSAIITIVGLLLYILLSTTASVKNPVYFTQTPPQNTTVVEVSGHSDKFNDPYYPPLKNDGVFFPIDSGDLRGIPPSLNGVGGGGYTGRSINIQTRGFSPEFTQIGILTREVGNGKNRKEMEDMIAIDPKILPLMGRRVMNGRDKYQYYTISNSGNVNTKLPIRKEGRNCINEYGCDPLYNGDIVFVEGYGDRFKATIYENELFRYIP